MERLEAIGLSLKDKNLKKGHIYDVIGLFEPVEEENNEILKFFNVSLKGMNQAKARYEVSKLLADQSNFDRWSKRPPTPIQREFYRFFSLKTPQDLNYETASKFIDDHKNKLAEENDSNVVEWEAFKSIYEEINDSEFRKDNDLKKISLALYRSAIDQLKNEGKTLSGLSNDTDIVVNKILEINPDIEKL
ncbi:MAG: hypothetical protein V1897_06360 [Pseudomonadota bacterium]